MNKHNVLNNVFCRLFEERCISIMDSMYQEDSQHAIDLMDDEAVVWGIHSSPLTFAYENFMYDVVAHTCSQKYMNISLLCKMISECICILFKLCCSLKATCI